MSLEYHIERKNQLFVSTWPLKILLIQKVLFEGTIALFPIPKLNHNKYHFSPTKGTIIDLKFIVVDFLQLMPLLEYKEVSVSLSFSSWGSSWQVIWMGFKADIHLLIYPILKLKHGFNMVSGCSEVICRLVDRDLLDLSVCLADY